MVDPFDEQTMNLEAACLDELGRAMAPEQTDDLNLPADQPLPVAGHSCRRDSKLSELSSSEFDMIEM